MARETNTETGRLEAPDVLWHGRYSLEERESMIRVAAYYRYVQRGCAPGHDLDDWLAAEIELGFGPPARFQPEVPEKEIQQSSLRGPHEDDALKRLVRQHPQQAIPRVESVEPESAPFRQ